MREYDETYRSLSAQIITFWKIIKPWNLKQSASFRLRSVLNSQIFKCLIDMTEMLF